MSAVYLGCTGIDEGFLVDRSVLSVDFVLGTEVGPQRKLTERSSNSDKNGWRTL